MQQLVHVPAQLGKSLWAGRRNVGLPVGVTFCRPLLVQSMLIVPLITTGSLKVTSTTVSVGTFALPSAGSVSVTVGGNVNAAAIAGEAVLRGESAQFSCEIGCCRQCRANRRCCE